MADPSDDMMDTQGDAGEDAGGDAQADVGGNAPEDAGDNAPEDTGENADGDAQADAQADAPADAPADDGDAQPDVQMDAGDDADPDATGDADPDATGDAPEGEGGDANPDATGDAQGSAPHPVNRMVRRGGNAPGTVSSQEAQMIQQYHDYETAAQHNLTIARQIVTHNPTQLQDLRERLTDAFRQGHQAELLRANAQRQFYGGAEGPQVEQHWGAVTYIDVNIMQPIQGLWHAYLPGQALPT